jgi:CubicO group peptidase (beta-lactamase class C family)
VGVSRLLDEAVAAGVCTAATLVASRPGHAAIEACAGGAEPGTVFDLASLTKILSTTAAGMLGPDPLTPVGSLVPEWTAGAEAGVTLAQLLHHESGLTWWRPFHEEVGAPPGAVREASLRDAVRGRLAALPLERPPGVEAVYSDPGFLLLEWALERALGGSPHELARRAWHEPLGMAATFFIDLTDPADRQRRLAAHAFAPTEDCEWRGRRLTAEVHDPNAHAMGGIAGHAGLFGIAADVHAFGRGVLDALRGRGPVDVGAEVVERFLTTFGEAEGTTRVLGWDTPTPGATSAGRHVSRAAVGHLGFTGTGLWVDPEHDIVVALLTNRVFHGAERREGIIRLRPAVHTAVYEALGVGA